MEKIQIEGSKTPFNLVDVKDNVIQLSGKWFWRDDSDRIIRVDGRYYRKKSPLIVETATKGIKYAVKDKCIRTDDGLWLVKDNPDTVKIDGKYYRSKYTVNIDGSAFLRSDPRIIQTFNGDWGLKDQCVKLSPLYYNNLFSKPNNTDIVDTPSGWIILGDSVDVMNQAGDVVKEHYQAIEREPHTRVFRDFTGSFNPTRVQLAHVKRTLLADFFTEIPEYGFYVHNSKYKEVKEKIDAYVEEKLRDKMEAIRRDMNESYSEVGDDENQAKIINLNGRRFPGNQVLYSPSKTEFKPSKSVTLTGNIGYTFGVEIETSAGLLADGICEELGVTKVGDGSIGSAEYVTPPLHGTTGIKRLEATCNALANATLVDDRCAIHIHVGGYNNPIVQSPNFDTEFMVNAIKLGCQIEEDLYKICPKTRNPEYKHTHSILRYKDISMSNWKDYIGAYVFSPQENWDRAFDMRDYRFGEDGRTANTTLGLYNGGRYKWLNLVNLVTNTSITTLEFRMFAGSTNFKKIKNYVLICLAFTWFVENRKADIEKGGVTLDSMIASAFSGSHELYNELYTFIVERRKRFNRKKVYNRNPFK